MATYIANAFSLNMVADDNDLESLRIRSISKEEIPYEIESVVGHADTAKVLAEYLKQDIALNRQTLELKLYDILYVAQYRGPRLEEGATSLPEGATFAFYEVSMIPDIGCDGCHASFCQHGLCCRPSD